MRHQLVVSQPQPRGVRHLDLPCFAISAECCASRSPTRGRAPTAPARLGCGCVVQFAWSAAPSPRILFRHTSQHDTAPRIRPAPLPSSGLQTSSERREQWTRSRKGSDPPSLAHPQHTHSRHDSTYTQKAGKFGTERPCKLRNYMPPLHNNSEATPLKLCRTWRICGWPPGSDKADAVFCATPNQHRQSAGARDSRCRPKKAVLRGMADLPVLVPDLHDPLLNLR